MKRFIHISNILSEIQKKRITTWFDRLTFFRILLIWISFAVLFGFVYFFFDKGNSFLFSNVSKVKVTSLLDCIYFSFITATTTGFGDIVPMGFFKIISTIQVVCGLLLLALVTSRLVSIKQDIILEEIYEISFNEKINKLRSSLLLFRQGLSRFIVKIEEKSISKKEVKDLYIEISHLENVLEEAIPFISRQYKHTFTKKLDPVNAELLLLSVGLSFRKLNELLDEISQTDLEWKRSITIDLIKKCILLYDECLEKIRELGVLDEKKLSSAKNEKEEVVRLIKKKIKI